MAMTNRRTQRQTEHKFALGNQMAGRRGDGPCIWEDLEPRQFFSASVITPDQASALTVTVGPHVARFAQFVDAQGNTDVFSLKGPGTATINFLGSELAATTVKGGGEVIGGSGIGVSSITVTGTNKHTSILFSRAKNSAAGAALPIPSLSAAGAVGALSGNIDLTGALTIGGSLGTLAVSGLDGGATPTSLTAASVGSLTDLGNLGENVGVTGTIGKVVVRGSVTGSISATLMTSLTVGGNITGSTITLGRPFIRRQSDLGKLIVTGSVSGTTIDAAGSIGPVAVGALSDTSIEAGVTLPGGPGLTGGLPNMLSEFTSEATLSSVKAASMTGSDIAAFTVGKLALGPLQTNNNGVPFGVAGATIAQITGIASLNGEKFNFKKLVNEAIAAADLAKLGISSTDFTITVV